jgi:trk system potassium uptake protein TrkA
MRLVFVGASSIALMSAQILLRQGHEVVIIEQDRERIAELSDEYACGFVHGDGSKPAILREVNPTATDFLFCLTGDDRVNIIASLVGRSLQFPHVVTRIDNPEFEHICVELGLQYTVIPDRSIARYLTDVVHGRDPLEISAMIKSDARFFSFVAKDDEAGAIEELKLPAACRVVCIYRGEDVLIPKRDDELIEAGDQIVLVVHSKNLSVVQERWPPQT